MRVTLASPTLSNKNNNILPQFLQEEGKEDKKRKRIKSCVFSQKCGRSTTKQSSFIKVVMRSVSGDGSDGKAEAQGYSAVYTRWQGRSPRLQCCVHPTARQKPKITVLVHPTARQKPKITVLCTPDGKAEAQDYSAVYTRWQGRSPRLQFCVHQMARQKPKITVLCTSDGKQMKFFFYPAIAGKSCSVVA